VIAPRPSPPRRRASLRCAPRRSRFRIGTTLIELILALGVLVLAAAIIVPTVLGLAESNRLMRTADDFKGLLAGLRSRALEESVAIEIAIEPNGAGYKVSRSDGSAPAAEATAAAKGNDLDAPRPEFDRDTVFADHKLPESVTFQNVRSPSADAATPAGTIRFYPNGAATPIEFEIADAAVPGSVRFHIRGLTGTIASRRIYPGRDSGSAAAETKP
jgi:Tfp pilus assembly protein FimT